MVSLSYFELYISNLLKENRYFLLQNVGEYNGFISIPGPTPVEERNQKLVQDFF